MGEQLGVDPVSVCQQLRRFNVVIQKRGGNYYARSKKAPRFLNIPASQMENMTLDTIAKKIGGVKEYAWQLTKKYNRDFKRYRDNRKVN